MTPAAFTTAVSSLTLDTAAYLGFAAVIIAAITSIWGVKKLIRLGNKS